MVNLVEPLMSGAFMMHPDDLTLIRSDVRNLLFFCGTQSIGEYIKQTGDSSILTETTHVGIARDRNNQIPVGESIGQHYGLGDEKGNHWVHFHVQYISRETLSVIYTVTDGPPLTGNN